MVDNIDKMDKKLKEIYVKACNGNLDNQLLIVNLYFFDNLPISCETIEKFLMNLIEDSRHESSGWNYLGVLNQHVYNDLETAKQCYKKSIEINNNASALNNLGVILESEKKYDEALKYYQLSCEQNYYQAFFNLGVMYLKGIGVDPNQDKAYELLKKSYDLFPDNQCVYSALGYLCYFCGYDKKKGLELLKKGADINDEACKYLLGKIEES